LVFIEQGPFQSVRNEQRGQRMTVQCRIDSSSAMHAPRAGVADEVSTPQKSGASASISNANGLCHHPRPPTPCHLAGAAPCPAHTPTARRGWRGGGGGAAASGAEGGAAGAGG